MPLFKRVKEKKKDDQNGNKMYCRQQSKEALTDDDDDDGSKGTDTKKRRWWPLKKKDKTKRTKSKSDDQLLSSPSPTKTESLNYASDSGLPPDRYYSGLSGDDTDTTSLPSNVLAQSSSVSTPNNPIRANDKAYGGSTIRLTLGSHETLNVAIDARSEVSAGSNSGTLTRGLCLTNSVKDDDSSVLLEIKLAEGTLLTRDVFFYKLLVILSSGTEEQLLKIPDNFQLIEEATSSYELVSKTDPVVISLEDIQPRSWENSINKTKKVTMGKLKRLPLREEFILKTSLSKESNPPDYIQFTVFLKQGDWEPYMIEIVRSVDRIAPEKCSGPVKRKTNTTKRVSVASSDKSERSDRTDRTSGHSQNSTWTIENPRSSLLQDTLLRNQMIQMPPMYYPTPNQQLMYRDIQMPVSKTISPVSVSVTPKRTSGQRFETKVQMFVSEPISGRNFHDNMQCTQPVVHGMPITHEQSQAGPAQKIQSLHLGDGNLQPSLTGKDSLLVSQSEDNRLQDSHIKGLQESHTVISGMGSSQTENTICKASSTHSYNIHNPNVETSTKQVFKIEEDRIHVLETSISSLEIFHTVDENINSFDMYDENTQTAYEDDMQGSDTEVTSLKDQENECLSMKVPHSRILNAHNEPNVTELPSMGRTVTEVSHAANCSQPTNDGDSYLTQTETSTLESQHPDEIPSMGISETGECGMQISQTENDTTKFSHQGYDDLQVNTYTKNCSPEMVETAIQTDVQANVSQPSSISNTENPESGHNSLLLTQSVVYSREDIIGWRSDKQSRPRTWHGKI